MLQGKSTGDFPIRFDGVVGEGWEWKYRTLSGCRGESLGSSGWVGVFVLYLFLLFLKGGPRTTRRPPDHRKETQTVVVRSCLPFIRSGQNHLARHNEMEKKLDPKKRGGKTTSEKGQTCWSFPSPRGQWRTEKNGGDWL